MLRYVCSKRVVPLMTNRMNAVRLARLVRHPVVGAIGQMLWSFNSPSQGYLQPVPQLEVRVKGVEGFGCRVQLPTCPSSCKCAM